MSMKRSIITTIMLVLFVFLALTSVGDAEKMMENAESQGFPNPLTTTSTVEEQLQWKADFTSWAYENSSIISLSGEETKGAAIDVNGETVQLPPDAFVKAFIVTAEFLPEYQSYHVHLPYYAIQRGDSVIQISHTTGVVVGRSLAAGDEHTFDFLEKAIQGFLPEVE